MWHILYERCVKQEILQTDKLDTYFLFSFNTRICAFYRLTNLKILLFAGMSVLFFLFNLNMGRLEF